MDMYLSEYLPIAIFLIIAVGLSGAFVLGSVLLGRSEPDIEKLTAYECGFDALTILESLLTCDFICCYTFYNI